MEETPFEFPRGFARLAVGPAERLSSTDAMTGFDFSEGGLDIFLRSQSEAFQVYLEAAVPQDSPSDPLLPCSSSFSDDSRRRTPKTQGRKQSGRSGCVRQEDSPCCTLSSESGAVVHRLASILASFRHYRREPDAAFLAATGDDAEGTEGALARCPSLELRQLNHSPRLGLVTCVVHCQASDRDIWASPFRVLQIREKLSSSSSRRTVEREQDEAEEEGEISILPRVLSQSDQGGASLDRIEWTPFVLYAFSPIVPLLLDSDSDDEDEDDEDGSGGHGKARILSATMHLLEEIMPPRKEVSSLVVRIRIRTFFESCGGAKGDRRGRRKRRRRRAVSGIICKDIDSWETLWDLWERKSGQRNAGMQPCWDVPQNLPGHYPAWKCLRLSRVPPGSELLFADGKHLPRWRILPSPFEVRLEPRSPRSPASSGIPVSPMSPPVESEFEILGIPTGDISHVRVQGNVACVALRTVASLSDLPESLDLDLDRTSVYCWPGSEATQCGGEAECALLRMFLSSLAANRLIVRYHLPEENYVRLDFPTSASALALLRSETLTIKPPTRLFKEPSEASVESDSDVLKRLASHSRPLVFNLSPFLPGSSKVFGRSILEIPPEVISHSILTFCPIPDAFEIVTRPPCKLLRNVALDSLKLRRSGDLHVATQVLCGPLTRGFLSQADVKHIICDFHAFDWVGDEGMALCLLDFVLSRWNVWDVSIRDGIVSALRGAHVACEIQVCRFLQT